MDLIHRIRTIAWYHRVSKLAGTKSAYALSKLVDELRHAKFGMKNLEVKDFGPYATGKVVPTEETLDMVEALFKDKGSSKAVYEIGPRLEYQGNDATEEELKKIEMPYAPLWMVLGGSEQVVRNVLVRYDNKFLESQTFGAPFLELFKQVLEDWLPIDMVMKGFYLDSENPEANIVALAYSEYDYPLNMERYVACLALWRLSMITNDAWPLVSYFMAGLNQRAVPDLLEPIGIARSVQDYCTRMDNHHWSHLAKFAKGSPDDANLPNVRVVSEMQPAKEVPEKGLKKVRPKKLSQDTASAALEDVWKKVANK